jgi:UDP-N-acetylglucosamine 2-epimerase (non-hydrolysing)
MTRSLASPRVVLTIYGTTGELIKLAPVLRRLQDRGTPVLTATTAQQVTQIPTFLDDFRLPAPTFWLARGAGGRDLEHRQDVPGWLGGVLRTAARRRRSLRAALHAGGTEPCLLVHGDTMTTVLGAAIGRVLGVPVAHIEAGLRSGSWREPFPEELDRRITSRLATVHFAPGAWAAQNLRDGGVRGTIVDTQGNTIADALALVPPVGDELDVPEERFGIVSLHREELLGEPALLRETLEAVARASARVPLLFVDHSVTIAALRRHGLDGLLEGTGVRRIPRQRYTRFIALLKRSAFMVTDSGGSQEECAYLGVPCLVHRRRTERQDGLDGAVQLSGLAPGAVEAFIDRAREEHPPPERPVVSPSAIIERWLLDRGVIAR